MTLKGNDRNFFWIFVMAGLSLLVHIFTFDALGFHRDELLYLATGKHPAAGYWSNPPLIGILSYAGQLLPWDTLFNIRLLPAMAGALLIILTGLIARELGGSSYAAILSCAVLSTSLLILRAFSMFQPVPFDILFWTALLYFLLRHINTGGSFWLICLGLTAGLGLLNKYMVAFLLFGILVGLMLTKYRKMLVEKYIWISVVLAFFVFLPNLLWQYNHGFPVLLHMQELKETQLVNVNRVDFLVDQLLMFTFGSVIWVAGLIWLFTRGSSGNFRIFGWIYVAVLALIIILRGKSYYTAGLYPFLFAAGGVAWDRMLKTRMQRILVPVILVVLSVPMIPAGIPLMKAPVLASYFSKIPPKMGAEALLRWEDGRMHSLPQDYADMLGWDELAAIVIKGTKGIDRSRIMIYGENYGEAGAIDHFGKAVNLPDARSFSDSYLLWMPDSVSSSIDFLVYINDERGEDIFPMFEGVDSLGCITNSYAREFGTSVYLCRNPGREFFDFVNSKLREIRKIRGLTESGT